MKHTTLTLAFLVTVLATGALSVLVLAQGPERPAPRRKGAHDDRATTRIIRPEVKAGVVREDETAWANEAAIGAKPVEAQGGAVAKPAAALAGGAEVQAEPAEREVETIIEYYPSGRVKAVWRGYKQDAARFGEAATFQSFGARSALSSTCSLEIRIGKDDKSALPQQRQLENVEIKGSWSKQSLSEIVGAVDSDSGLRVGVILLEPAAVRHGLYESWHENGQLECRAEYRDGNLVGSYSAWYDNGQLRETSEYEDGRRHGVMRTFFANGQRALESNWVGGVMHGGYTAWYAGGQLNATGQFLDGLRDGYWAYWNEDGSKAAEGRFERDEEVGEWLRYGSTPQESVQESHEEPCIDPVIEDSIEIKTVQKLVKHVSNED
ncbi:toxin-antitoxin system YwqK family antitoxin [bacterium]|nr:MAG: toxin-antitoxin system YwqK family antitoxin [bacterium]RIK65691.1 MAG: hypothetical protein DCC64_00825 [Planctomycetota bacterium]